MKRMAHRRRATDLPWEYVKTSAVLVVCLVAGYVAMLALIVAAH
jgi:hypothetical protein